jgi:hypothetical protein
MISPRAVGSIISAAKSQGVEALEAFQFTITYSLFMEIQYAQPSGTPIFIVDNSPR